MEERTPSWWSKFIDRGLLLLVGVAVTFVCLFGLAAYIVFERELAYPIPVKDFRAQTANVQPGMSEQQVRAAITRFTGVERRDDRLIFILEARNKTEGILLRVDWRIFVEFDDQGRVSKIKTGDG